MTEKHCPLSIDSIFVISTRGQPHLVRLAAAEGRVFFVFFPNDVTFWCLCDCESFAQSIRTCKFSVFALEPVTKKNSSFIHQLYFQPVQMSNSTGKLSKMMARFCFVIFQTEPHTHIIIVSLTGGRNGAAERWIIKVPLLTHHHLAVRFQSESFQVVS